MKIAKKLAHPNSKGPRDHPLVDARSSRIKPWWGTIAWLLMAMCWASLTAPSFAQEKVLIGDFVPSSDGERLVRGLANSLNPEEMVVIFDQDPQGGEAGHMYVLARGVSAAIRVDTAAMEAFFVKPSDGGSYPFTAVNGLFLCSVRANDVNRFLKDTVVGSKEQSWKGLSVDFQGGRIKASGTFTSKGISAVVRLDGVLSIKDQSQVELKDYQVKVNGSTTHMAEIRRAIDDAQPLLDLSSMPFPVRLKVISAEQGILTISTEKVPLEFQGQKYIYRRVSP